MREGNVVLPDCRRKRQQLLQEARYYLLKAVVPPWPLGRPQPECCSSTFSTIITPYTSSPTPKTAMVVISTCMGPRPDLKGIFQVLNANEIPGLVKFIYDQNGVKIKQAIR